MEKMIVLAGSGAGTLIPGPVTSSRVNNNAYQLHAPRKNAGNTSSMFGRLAYYMPGKIKFSFWQLILAAPTVPDLALFGSLARRAGLAGIQEWPGFHFKSPQSLPGWRTENGICKQLVKLENTLRFVMGEDLITHHAPGYYGEELAMV